MYIVRFASLVVVLVLAKRGALSRAMAVDSPSSGGTPSDQRPSDGFSSASLVSPPDGAQSDDVSSGASSLPQGSGAPPGSNPGGELFPHLSAGVVPREALATPACDATALPSTHRCLLRTSA